MNNVNAILGEYGYIYAGTCRCDGYFTKKYRKPKTTIQIRWRVARQRFKVMEGNSTLHTWRSIGELEKTLNELATQNI